MRSTSVGILTFTDDLHALVIQDRLRKLPGTTCEVIEADSMADNERGLTWSTLTDLFPVAIPTRDGRYLDIAGCDALWYRRAGRPQRALQDLAEPAYVDVINRSCSSTLLGALFNHFRGVWVSHPDATRRAENKLTQLKAAQIAGFKVPRTLVSQNPTDIKRFCDLMGGKAILKTVRGTPTSQLYTLRVTPEHLQHEESLRMCPTIYQEYVPGSNHLRVLCCGPESYAVTIETEFLDWRMSLDVPMTPTELDAETAKRLSHVLEVMGLKMGVIDLKIDDQGEPVWIELNPQGQFLFVEGLTGIDLAGAFSAFLHREAVGAARRRG